MKKKHLKHIMAAGITYGLIIASQASAQNGTGDKKEDPKETSSLLQKAAEYGGNITHHLMSEEELLLQLNDEGTRLYNSLSPEGKALAIEVASQSCDGTNKCAGLNACASDKNTCAGKGACKGLSKCAISDKNLAVKLAEKKMAEKREVASKK